MLVVRYFSSYAPYVVRAVSYIFYSIMANYTLTIEQSFYTSVVAGDQRFLFVRNAVGLLVGDTVTIEESIDGVPTGSSELLGDIDFIQYVPAPGMLVPWAIFTWV